MSSMRTCGMAKFLLRHKVTNKQTNKNKKKSLPCLFFFHSHSLLRVRVLFGGPWASSLEVQPRDRSAWRQYFTLGEIFKAYGHFQESVNHLRQALELYPQYEPIKKAIADVENISASSLHIFTVIIIIFLVCVFALYFVFGRFFFFWGGGSE